MRATMAGASLFIALAGIGCGGATEASKERSDPFVAIEREFDRDQRRAQRAAPRWETVALLRGTGAATHGVTISDRAIQWRARWTCRSGDFRLAVSPGRSQTSTSDGTCPVRRTAGFIGTGERHLRVDASHAWRLVVEQEVDTPLREPRLRSMRSGARVAARGRFYGVERRGKGTVELYRLASGRLALRFEGFETSPNTDLFVWTSPAERPRTTRQVLAHSHRTVAALKSTQGDQNYLLPRRTRARDLRSVVIWCEPVRIVYAAAALAPAD